MGPFGLAQLTTIRAIACEIRATAVLAKQHAIETGNVDSEMRWIKVVVLSTQLHALLKQGNQSNAWDRCIPFHSHDYSKSLN